MNTLILLVIICVITVSAYQDDECIEKPCWCCENHECIENGDGNHCVKCIQGYTMKSCTEPCPEACLQCSQDFYGNDTNKRVCEKCKDGYYNGRYKDDPKSFEHKDCSLKCNDSCTSCTSFNNCTQCKPGYYFATQNNCRKCTAFCEHCLSADECLTCNSGYFWTGTYCDLCGNDKCYKCPTSCKECFSENNCTACESGFYENNGTCYLCREHCKVCKSYNECLECNAGYEGSVCEDKQTNFNACRDGFSGHNCDIPCSYPCASCERNFPAKCKSCVYDRHGINCSQKCSINCYAVTCNDINGFCTHHCISGYWGNTCENKCPAYCSTYGCDKTTGSCICPPRCVCGEDGVCIGCKYGFGDECDKNCSKGCLNGQCFWKTGECSLGCVIGYKGSQCDTPDLRSGISTDKDTSKGFFITVLALLALLVVLAGINTALQTRGFFRRRKRKPNFETRSKGYTGDGSTRTEETEPMLVLSRNVNHDSTVTTSTSEANAHVLAADRKTLHDSTQTKSTNQGNVPIPADEKNSAPDSTVTTLSREANAHVLVVDRKTLHDSTQTKSTNQGNVPVFADETNNAHYKNGKTKSLPKKETKVTGSGSCSYQSHTDGNKVTQVVNNIVVSQECTLRTTPATRKYSGDNSMFCKKGSEVVPPKKDIFFNYLFSLS